MSAPAASLSIVTADSKSASNSRPSCLTTSEGMEHLSSLNLFSPLRKGLKITKSSSLEAKSPPVGAVNCLDTPRSVSTVDKSSSLEAQSPRPSRHHVYHDQLRLPDCAKLNVFTRPVSQTDSVKDNLLINPTLRASSEVKHTNSSLKVSMLDTNQRKGLVELITKIIPTDSNAILTRPVPNMAQARGAYPIENSLRKQVIANNQLPAYRFGMASTGKTKPKPLVVATEQAMAKAGILPLINQAKALASHVTYIAHFIPLTVQQARVLLNGSIPIADSDKPVGISHLWRLNSPVLIHTINKVRLRVDKYVCLNKDELDKIKNSCLTHGVTEVKPGKFLRRTCNRMNCDGRINILTRQCVQCDARSIPTTPTHTSTPRIHIPKRILNIVHKVITSPARDTCLKVQHNIMPTTTLLQSPVMDISSPNLMEQDDDGASLASASKRSKRNHDEINKPVDRVDGFSDDDDGFGNFSDDEVAQADEGPTLTLLSAMDDSLRTTSPEDAETQRVALQQEIPEGCSLELQSDLNGLTGRMTLKGLAVDVVGFLDDAVKNKKVVNSKTVQWFSRNTCNRQADHYQNPSKLPRGTCLLIKNFAFIPAKPKPVKAPKTVKVEGKGKKPHIPKKDRGPSKQSLRREASIVATKTFNNSLAVYATKNSLRSPLHDPIVFMGFPDKIKDDATIMLNITIPFYSKASRDQAAVALDRSGHNVSCLHDGNTPWFGCDERCGDCTVEAPCKTSVRPYRCVIVTRLRSPGSMPSPLPTTMLTGIQLACANHHPAASCHFGSTNKGFADKSVPHMSIVLRMEDVPSPASL